MLAILAPAKPFDAAQGFINNCPAPAEPARSGLPAQTVPRPMVAINSILKCFFILEIIKVNRSHNSEPF